MPKLNQPDFQYDTLVDRINICNREQEVKNIQRHVQLKRPQIIFAPRRYGKTSILKNVIAQDFEKPKSIAIYFDLMDVSTLESLSHRIQIGLSKALEQHTRIKSLLQQVIEYFKGLKISASIDPATQLPSIEIAGGFRSKEYLLDELFSGLSKLAKSYPLLLIFDEFQDITLIKEAAAQMRAFLQQLNKTPVILSGSKRIILQEMFSSNKSPFFNYGEEVVFDKIALEHWHPYFQLRLKQNSKSISLSALELLGNEMCHVPNAICEVGFWLKESSIRGNIGEKELNQELERMVDSKSHSLRYQTSQMSASELSVTTAVAKRKYVQQIAAKDFVNECGTAQSAIRKIIERHVKSGFIEWEMDSGYRLSDPVLSYFLRTHN